MLYGFTLIYRGCNLAAHLSHHHRKHHTHCSQSFVSPDWIPPSTYSWQPKKLPACPPFLSSSLFTWINPLKASFLLSKKHAPFAAKVVDSRPSVLLHPSGGINSVNTSLDTNPVTGCAQVCLTSQLTRAGVTHFPQKISHNTHDLRIDGVKHL